MAITINALTTGTGGLETTADASGSFSFQSDGSTIATVTSSGFSVTGTFNAGSLQVGGSDVVVDTDIGSTVPSVSGSGATGTWSVSISGNAATVTNGVYTTGSYANPSWITSLDDGKVLPTMTGNSGKYLTTDGTNSSWATIASSQWTTSGSDIYYNTGNVGIGTSSPTTKLHVSDTGTGTLISSSSDTTNTGFSWSDGTISGVLVASGVGGTALYTQSNHPTVFGTNNTERMRIDSSGNVGIGTSTPNTKFHVQGADVRFTAANYVSTSVGTGILIDYPSTYSRISSYINGFSAWGNLVLQEGGGNVGIGTSSPSSKLEVNGTCTATTFVGSLSGTADRAYEWKGSGSTSNWNTQFQDTETQSATQIDLNGGTNCPTGGGWWFAESFRHSNGGSYWGLQYAHGWEDRAYQRYVRNVSANSFGSWQLDVGCRAWIKFNGSGTVTILANGNVTSVTDLAVGQYRINFTTAMLDANYAAVCNSANPTAAIGNDQNSVGVTCNYLTTSVSIQFEDVDAGYTDCNGISVAIFR